jgi:hypothetical protein
LKKIKLAVGVGEEKGHRSMIFLGHGRGFEAQQQLVRWAKATRLEEQNATGPRNGRDDRSTSIKHHILYINKTPDQEANKAVMASCLFQGRVVHHVFILLETQDAALPHLL